jgi:hypothetical protein
MRTDREKLISSLIDDFKPQNEWDNYKNMLINKFKKDLDKEKYKLIKNEDELNDIIPGGYIKYIKNEELKSGGILIKKYKTHNNYLVLSFDNNIFIKLCFEKHIIFYKKHVTIPDKRREIFISSLEKYGNDYSDDE